MFRRGSLRLRRTERSLAFLGALSLLLPGTSGATPPERGAPPLPSAPVGGEPHLARSSPHVPFPDVPLDHPEPRLQGLVEFAWVGTDTGTGGTAPLTRWAGRDAQSFFTLPRVSLAFSGFPRRGDGTLPERPLRVHLHLDLEPDSASQGTTLPAGLAPAGASPGGIPRGQGTGLNEAYVEFEGLLPDSTLRLGGFALPFQDGELDGPMRSPRHGITPSPGTTFLERLRVLGLELRTDPAGLPGGRWLPESSELRLGLFSGGDTGTTLAGVLPVIPSLGAMHDGFGQGALTHTATLVDRPGVYLDLRSEWEGGHPWGLRAGWLDNRRDPGVGSPTLPAGVARALALELWQVGAWMHRGRLELRGEHLAGEARIGLGAGHRNSLATTSWTGRWQLSRETVFQLRHDRWSNRLDAPGPGSTRGSAWTASLSRELRSGLLLLTEWTHPEEEDPARPGLPDREDDRVQVRLRVNF